MTYDYVDSAFKSPITSISIGPGIRGIERGVERVIRLEHLAYVEIEAFIIENLVAQMERGVLAPAVIWSDAKTLPCEPFRGITDILFAGYPCQPFSTAGKRRGTEDPRHLYPYIERAIRIIRPRICFFENVRGHVTCGLPEVVASLEGLGYRVRWGIYSAEETGAAHKRERVFILAVEYSELQSINTRLGCGSLGTKSTGFQRSAITDNAGNELAHPINNGQCNGCSEIPSAKDSVEGEAHREGWNQEIGEWMRDESQYSGAMADTKNNRREGEAWRIEHREKRWSLPEELAARCKFIRHSESVGHSNDQGLQGRISGECEECTGEWPARANGPFARGIVSRPGQPQQAWEHPRVISRKVESAVGLSAHGYHFREDILRALGNSVYEDTVELAFRDLARKHGLSLEKIK